MRLLERVQSPEQLIMLGMMADAADEGYMLTAFCDDGDMDLSSQVEEIGIFVENSTWLFEKKGSLCGRGHNRLHVVRDQGGPHPPPPELWQGRRAGVVQ